MKLPYMKTKHKELTEKIMKIKRRASKLGQSIDEEAKIYEVHKIRLARKPYGR